MTNLPQNLSTCITFWTLKRFHFLRHSTALPSEKCKQISVHQWKRHRSTVVVPSCGEPLPNSEMHVQGLLLVRYLYTEVCLSDLLCAVCCKWSVQIPSRRSMQAFFQFWGWKSGYMLMSQPHNGCYDTTFSVVCRYKGLLWLCEFNWSDFVNGGLYLEPHQMTRNFSEGLPTLQNLYCHRTLL